MTGQTLPCPRTATLDHREYRRATLLSVLLDHAASHRVRKNTCATGRRLGSIRQLAWDDIDFTRDTILWRADTDKKGKAWTVPMTPTLRDEIRSFRVRLGSAFGSLVFPSDKDSSAPVRSDVFAKWLREAEKKAGLEKLDGSLWHCYRRKWATERKNLPISDVAAAGGWLDTTTLLRCYQQPDDETMLRVMNEPRKLTERAKSG